MIHMNYQITTAGTVTGSLAIYQSNDNDRLYWNGALQPYGIQNWSQLLTLQITGSSNTVVNMQHQAMSWLQCRWSHDSGVGSMDINFTAKGDA